MDFSTEPGPKMGSVTRGNKSAAVTSMSYHESGSHLYVASESDSTMRIVDCLRSDDDGQQGQGQSSSSSRPKLLRFQREGIRIVRAAHHGHCVLFSPGTFVCARRARLRVDDARMWYMWFVLPAEICFREIDVTCYIIYMC